MRDNVHVQYSLHNLNFYLIFMFVKHKINYSTFVVGKCYYLHKSHWDSDFHWLHNEDLHNPSHQRDFIFYSYT
jgi:hypothetical protein